jgi:hypothetical protein
MSLERRGTQSAIGVKKTLVTHLCRSLNKWDIFIYVYFLLQVFDLLGETFHCSQDLFGRAYGRL